MRKIVPAAVSIGSALHGGTGRDGHDESLAPGQLSQALCGVVFTDAVHSGS
ncbi:MAG TPA: hypothetical protein VEV45_11810 [Streptosporangiaceae bacterium]|nr:hypothetical protein [Streptosporangiaceae bacterium]